MPGPQSYTRQDVVEIHLPAIEAALGELLASLHDDGVRAASPGEFTRRALLHGRVSIAQAEAIGELIRANTVDEARSWAAITGAARRNAPAGLRDEVDELLALLELGLDFSQEDVCLMPREDLARRLSSLIRRLSTAVQSDREGTSGLAWGGVPRVVLVGPTGAGKSTLLNILTGRGTALVSAKGHTTRDPVEVLHHLEPGLTVRLIDTAGLGCPVTSPPLAVQSMAATEHAVKAADILLLVLDRTTPLTTERERLMVLLRTAKPAAAALVWNKSDLLDDRNASAPESLLVEALRREAGMQLICTYRVTAIEGEGIDGLLEFLRRQTRSLQVRLASAWSLGMAAQRTGYASALAALQRAQDASQCRLGEDAIAVELREASHALSDAQGVLLRHDELTESLLDRIFSRFCIGK
jgi:tRNA modification GTPase